ncbi:MAG: DUF2277 family protein [Acidimicrobiales bacterium]
MPPSGRAPGPDPGHPSKANTEVFERALEEVAESVHRLLGGLVTGSRGASTPQP